VVDLEAPDRRRTFAVVPDGEEVIGVRFVPGSRLLVVAGPTLFTALVDTDTGRIIRALDRPGAEGLFTPGVSGDGRLLATPGATHGGDLIEVDLWSLPDGHRVGEPLRVDRQIHDLQLSPDGRLFIVVLANAGLEGGSVEAWDVRTRRRVRALRFARIQSFARFSPDGRRFAVGNRSGETRVYETATFKPVTRVLSGDAGAIISAAITPDRRTLATGSETGAVQLWDIPSGQALGAPLPGVPSSGVIPDFTPDGSTLVAAYASGRAYLWDIRPASLAQHACAVAGRRLTRAEWAEFLPGRDYEPAC
jgi:WD40 repeat protein